MDRRLIPSMNEDIALQFQETVNSLVQTLIKPETLKRDLFFAFLLTVIKANHFLLKQKEINTVEYILSRRAEDETIYEAEFVLSPFQETPAKIIACPLGNAILVNSMVPDISKESYSLCFDVNKYIKSSPLGMPSSLNNLEELYIDLKDKIVNPIKSAILNFYDMPSSSLSGLPEEVLHQIILYLPIKDVINLSKCCKRFEESVKEDQIWFRLYKRDFRNVIKSKQAMTWRNKYKSMYSIKREGNLMLARNINEEMFNEFPEDFVRHVRNASWEVIV